MIDHHDAVALAELLDEDAVLLVLPPHRDGAASSRLGRDALVLALASLFSGRAWARHFVSNEMVEKASDGTLTISCYFRFVPAETTGRVAGLGDYEARLDAGGGCLGANIAGAE